LLKKKTLPQTEVAKLHAHRRKYKQRFNDNIHITGEQFVDLEERTTEVHDLYNALSERLDEGMEANQNAQAQIDALQSQINAVPEEAAPQVEATPSYAEEAKASIQALEQMVTGVCSRLRYSLMLILFHRDDRSARRDA
jgi:predicted  nucleic acid-binding Zn-ribbon protein